MADITVTPASVIPSTRATITDGVCGATIVAGQVVYKDTANSNVLKLAQHDGTALEATVAGIALNGGAAGQVIRYVTKDPELTLGATMAVGDIVLLGSVAGGMTIDAGDLASGEYKVILGICSVLNSKINFQIVSPGAVLA